MDNSNFKKFWNLTEDEGGGPGGSPTVNAGGGNIAGIGVPPGPGQGEPPGPKGLIKKKKVIIKRKLYNA